MQYRSKKSERTQRKELTSEKETPTDQDYGSL